MTDKECQKLADCYGFPFYRFSGDYVSNVAHQPGRGDPIQAYYPVLKVRVSDNPREHGLGEQCR